MIKKMWQRLLGSLLAIILIVPFCFVTAKADNGSNYIGEDTKNNVNVVVSYNSEKVSVAWYTNQIWKYTVSINYNCVANTTTRIYHAGLSNNAHFLSYNCTIENVTSNYIEIKTVNQSYAELEIYETDPITFSMVIGLQSATKIAEGTNSQLKTITDTYLSSMKTSLSALRTQVDNIAGYVDGLEGYVDGIEGKLDLAYTRLGEINTAMSVVSDLVNNVDATLGDISLEMEYFETQLRNIKSNLDTQINQLQTITLVLGDIIDAITALNTTVTGIDNLIDTVTWNQNSTNFYFKGYSTDKTNVITSISSSVQVLKNNNVYFHFKAFGSSNQTLYYLRIPFAFGATNYYGSTLELSFSNGSSIYNNPEYYYFVADGCTHIFVLAKFTNSLDLIVGVKPSNNGYIYQSTFTGSFLKWIYDTDIEFWQLLSFIREYNYQMKEIANNELIEDKLDDIIAAIGNVSVSNEQIDNSTTTFDNSVNQFQTVENIYNQQFNEVKNNVNNFDFSVSNGLSSGALQVSDLFSSFYNIEFFRVPILIVLACAIFLIVLG